MTINHAARSTVTTTYTTMATALGDLTVVVRDGVVVGLYFPHHWYMPGRAGFGEWSDVGFDGVRGQVGEYLAGERRRFDIATSTDGDDRQERVWDLVR